MLALASALWGQQDAPLVGLPEYGVTLTENRREPDHRQQFRQDYHLILRFEYENGRGTGQYINLKTRGIRLNVKNLAVGLLPGCTESPRPGDVPAAVQTRDANSIPPTIIRIVLLCPLSGPTN
jgi:hypothetical protein